MDGSESCPFQGSPMITNKEPLLVVASLSSFTPFMAQNRAAGHRRAAHSDALTLNGSTSPHRLRRVPLPTAASRPYGKRRIFLGVTFAPGSCSVAPRPLLPRILCAPWSVMPGTAILTAAYPRAGRAWGFCHLSAVAGALHQYYPEPGGSVFLINARSCALALAYLAVEIAAFGCLGVDRPRPRLITLAGFQIPGRIRAGGPWGPGPSCSSGGWSPARCSAS